MNKGRRKKLVNSRERVARDILGTAAGRNGARVYAKMRIADVLEIDGSGLDNAHYGYALKAHFDFVVADGDDMPLFAVEFDGPHHDQDRGAQINDGRKNLICRELGLPLARVRDEHIFRKARGIDYLTWFTELYFSFEALCDAQQSGIIPWDEPLDPTMFASHPHVPGRFPLFISAQVRQRLAQLHKEGLLTAPVPEHFSGYEPGGRASALIIAGTKDGQCLASAASLYLEGFGLLASEAAEEIAIVNLGKMAEDDRETGRGALAPVKARAMLVDLVRRRGGSLSMGSMGDINFEVGFEMSGGKSRWRFPALGDAPRIEIDATRL